MTKGHTAWAPANVDRLCQGASSAEPARCFARAMHGAVNWGGGTQWQWSNAIDLCVGTSDSQATIACFQRRIAEGQTWQAGIASCKAGSRVPIRIRETIPVVDPPLCAGGGSPIPQRTVLGTAPWRCPSRRHEDLLARCVRFDSDRGRTVAELACNQPSRRRCRAPGPGARGC